ncbi:Triosephosphate isomerase [Limtongia smithiae]|uniref:Triosephosphate isomerase n=1 Tax=Limtongia smithiae TaxID=1125753 RepID=UPI0034CE2DCD
MPAARTPLIGVSLKMYFTPAETAAYVESAYIPVARSAIDLGVSTIVIPDFVSLSATCGAVRDAFGGDPAGGAGEPSAAVGAQDCFYEDAGAYTGEVSPRTVAAVGARYVLVGHAERRRVFGESDAAVGLKTAAAARNGLVPVVCVGERKRGGDGDGGDHAVGVVRAQLAAALADVSPAAPVVIAYEPVWAIGQRHPAPTAHINTVCRAIRGALDAAGRQSSARVLYGGSAGEGMFGELDGRSVDGLLVARAGHVGAQLAQMVRDVAGKLVQGGGVE